MSRDWEELARREPYFAILTEERFLSSQMDEAALTEFFASGERDVDFLRSHLSFEPRDVLDFGCGAGRLTRAFAARGAHAVGVDAAPTMIALARKHSPEIEFHTSLDEVRDRTFDLIASLIVFQHIPVRDGEALYARLLSMLRPGGAAMVEFSFARPGGALKRFARALRARFPIVHRVAQIVRREKSRLPYMQMNVYDRARIERIIRDAGCSEPSFIATEHGGIKGAIVVTQKRNRTATE